MESAWRRVRRDPGQVRVCYLLGGFAPRRGSTGTSSRNARNQRSRSSQGTAAFAGEVEGRTTSSVSPSRRSWSPWPGRPPNGAPVRLLADEADRTRPQLVGQPLEPLRAAGEVALAQVRRAARRPVRRVRDPDSEPQDVDLLGGVHQARREAGGVQQPPEVVARVGEVRGRGIRVEAGVDPAEDDVEIRCEHVGDSALRDGCHGGAP